MSEENPGKPQLIQQVSYYLNYILISLFDYNLLCKTAMIYRNLCSFIKMISKYIVIYLCYLNYIILGLIPRYISRNQ